MKLSLNGIKNRSEWEAAGIVLPGYDVKAVAEQAKKAPRWAHFGIGNIFRIFIGGIADGLLESGDLDTALTCVETFDYDVVDKIYHPFDNLGLSVILNNDGTKDCKVLGSFGEALKAQSSDPALWARLKEIFSAPSLQLVSFTITEKGYALTNSAGTYFPYVQADIDNGPDKVTGAMGVVTAMLLERYKNGKTPLALVSMDNCSKNGSLLRRSVITMAEEWQKKGYVEDGFLSYVSDEATVSFPWTMIDKITPRPNPEIAADLSALGLENMEPIETSKRTYIAPFINGEDPQYLVIEDNFPNGRPALEKAGVYFTDRETVNKVEKMKVCTCLNPLHTALAVYGCLLGYDLISSEMKDEDLVSLIKRIGYTEGLPVVVDPGIIEPRKYIDEVVNLRLPNPFMPDTPQRIATDTSQKLSIRFGETIKAYIKEGRDLGELKAIPMVYAGWMRYVLGLDDELNEFTPSPDPLLEYARNELKNVGIGKKVEAEEIKSLLENESIFGVDLIKTGLADIVVKDLNSLLKGKGAVRETLKNCLK